MPPKPSTDETTAVISKPDAPKDETPKEAVEEQKFTVEELAAHSHRAFGCTPWAVHGALEPLRAKHFTVAEAKAKIAAHLETEVKL